MKLTSQPSGRVDPPLVSNVRFAGTKMARILKLFQIHTIRSAWVFLIGSGILFIYGIYQSIIYTNQILNTDITFFIFWFLITAIYMAIASWALFSEEGKSYLKAQEKAIEKSKRNILWYFKFLFSCYAAAFATMILLGVASLPFVGHSGFDAILRSPNQGLYLLICGLAWAPQIFRHLK
jgi:hypothetical protein